MGLVLITTYSYCKGPSLHLSTNETQKHIFGLVGPTGGTGAIPFGSVKPSKSHTDSEFCLLTFFHV